MLLLAALSSACADPAPEPPKARLISCFGRRTCVTDDIMCGFGDPAEQRARAARAAAEISDDELLDDLDEPFGRALGL